MSYEKWSELPYAGERTPPRNGEEPLASSWTLNYLNRDTEGSYVDADGKKINLTIKDPHQINWEQQLKKVLDAEQQLSEEDKLLATYWGTGVPTKQITPMMDILIDTYGVTAARAARMLAVMHSALNDAFVVTWDLKYEWDVARPNQLNQELETLLCTPRHPSYPSGHAVIAGCSEVMMSYFFPAERHKIKKLAEDCADSRLYALVHFPVDNSEGLRLGRQIGDLIIKEIRKQKDENLRPIDKPYTRSKRAKILPDLNSQAIPFNFPSNCSSLVRKEEQ
ncbi:vanadium-dependent haloperoxidase [Bacillus suaedaesalsae]|uniref:Vanadium-dependent haloperoxidase n=1 Tax=Bacillus suaedaesalsae TaxID=2810349 RepID=A0ABS2DL60_9BACI|nr:vanadium-dependent haloperoxidase [Bacillus suaedaesalsae]MBM6618208.1 vanadium-dependent haloperoxidase [Bacillus suaedaesalsae]